MAYTILVVDDESVTRTILRLILVHAGYKVYEAENGKDALEKISEHMPDLVLLDVMMPEMDGFAVYETLQQDEATSGLPIIFLSGKTDQEYVGRGLALGAIDYLVKPLGSEYLLQAIQKVANLP